MSVRYKNGKYIVDYYPNGRGGRRVVFTLPLGTTDTQAHQIERELRSKKQSHHPTSPSGNIATLYPHYIQHCTMHQSPDTVRDKRSYFNLHILPYYGRYHIQDITNAMVTAWKQAMQGKTYRGKPITNRTITKGMCYFSGFLKWAEEETNTSPPQPLRFRRLPHTRPMPIVLSLDEALAFISAAEQPYKTIFQIFFYLGLRNQAARRLKWEDVDWTSHGLKTIEKGTKIKWHPIPDDLFENLRALYIKTSSQWIFPSPRNQEKPIVNILKAVARARKKAGIKKRVYPHLLRHSIATHLVDSDIDIRQIQSFLGHSQISTTEWYTQVSFEKKRQALEKAGIKTSKM